MNKHLSVGLAVLALAASRLRRWRRNQHNAHDGGTRHRRQQRPPANRPPRTASDSSTVRPQDRIVQQGRHCGGRQGHERLLLHEGREGLRDKSNCTGDCLVKWPPVIATCDAPKVEGVTGKVGTITTPDGKKQVTVNGMPVYLWQKDKAPGDITGQGVGNVWYLVAPSGEMITARRRCRCSSRRAARGAARPAAPVRFLELDSGHDFLGVRVEHEGLVVVFDHQEVAVVRAEVPGEDRLAVVVVVRIAHGDLLAACNRRCRTARG